MQATKCPTWHGGDSMLHVPKLANGKNSSPCCLIAANCYLDTLNKVRGERRQSWAVTRQRICLQVGLAVGSIGLSAAILLSSVQTAYAVTPEQLLFLEASFSFPDFTLSLQCLRTLISR